MVLDDMFYKVLGKTQIAPAINIVAVPNTAGGVVVAAAHDRRSSITIQNTGAKPCLIRLGGDPSSTAYHIVLSADSGTRNGVGGAITLDTYNGAIKALCEDAAGTVVVVTEVLA